MISNQNPVEILRKIINQIKGIQKVDEWKVYLGVAFFSIALSLLFMMYSIFYDHHQISVISKNQHLTLSIGDITPKAVVKPVNQVERNKAKETAKVVNENKSTIENGDWYYDEIHKDWRYKKK